MRRVARFGHHCYVIVGQAQVETACTSVFFAVPCYLSLILLGTTSVQIPLLCCACLTPHRLWHGGRLAVAGCAPIMASAQAVLGITSRVAALMRSCVGLACPGQMSASKFQDQAWSLGDMDRDESAAVSELPASSGKSDSSRPAFDERPSDRSKDGSRNSHGGKDNARDDGGSRKGSERSGGSKRASSG